MSTTGKVIIGALAVAGAYYLYRRYSKPSQEEGYSNAIGGIKKCPPGYIWSPSMSKCVWQGEYIPIAKRMSILSRIFSSKMGKKCSADTTWCDDCLARGGSCNCFPEGGECHCRCHGYKSNVTS